MLSYRELQHAAALIDRDFRGARVQRIVQAGLRELCLVLRDARRETTGLHFCVEPARARVLRGAAPRGDGAAASGFGELLRARLKSQHLRGARILSRDRLVEFVFDNELCLLLAVMGPRSNLLLLDGDQRVLGSLRPLPETHRRLRPGGVWEAPKSDPPREGADRFAELDDDAWWEAMRGHYQGLESREHDEAVQRRVAKALRKARQALDKKRGLLEGDIAAGEEAARLRQDGERLKSVIAELAPGVGEARGSDFAPVLDLEK